PVLSYVDEKGFEDLKVDKGQLSLETRFVKESAVYQAALTRKNHVALQYEPFIKELKGSGFIFAITGQSYFDEFSGTVIGYLPFPYGTIAKRPDFFRNGINLLVDNNFVVKDYYEKPVNQVGKGISNIPSGLKLDPGELGSGKMRVNDNVGYWGKALLEFGEFQILLFVPETDFMETPRVMRNIIIWVTFIVVLISVLISLSLSRSITSPLMRLVKITDGIAKGDLTQKAQINSQDEVGVLSQRFDKMVLEIRKTQQKLTDSRDFLNSVIHSMTDSLIVLSKVGSIVMVNRASCNLLGYSMEELKGMSWKNVLADTELLGDDPDGSAMNMILCST
ncbi:MAG: PAS domain S-box protein, partial [Desulfobacteraceae bacterium]|nr:PAS domain S-box protein [Desulfobacteraceae bacterium]